MNPDKPDDYQPMVNDTYLDSETLEHLISDIEALGQVLLVTLKGHGAGRANGESVPLREAYEAFKSRAALGLQIRYLHEGQEWWDTLMHTPLGVRLVRIAHELE